MKPWTFEEFEEFNNLFWRLAKNGVCDYCGFELNPGVKNKNYQLHIDCHRCFKSEIMPKFAPYTKILNIKNSRLEVTIKREAFNELVSHAVDQFPSQHNYAMIGEDLEVTGFTSHPSFDYEVMPDNFFSLYVVKENTKECLEELRKIDNLIGFCHSHDGKDMSLSDMRYPGRLYLETYFEWQPFYQYQAHLNSFYPVFKELTLYNQEKGGKPLIDLTNEYPGFKPSEQFKKLLSDEFLIEAKNNAKETILKSPENFFGLYSNPIQLLLGLTGDEIAKLMIQHDEITNTYEKISDLKKSQLIQLYSGMIKDFNYQIK